MSRTPDFDDAGVVTIRSATPKDADAVHAIAESAGIDTWRSRQYREEAIRPDTVFLVAELHREVVGFLCGRVVPGTMQGNDGEIYNISISASVRSKGVGSMILEHALVRFREAGCGAVWLEVRESNEIAIRFYERNGFTASGRRRNFYSSPTEDAIVMRLTLDTFAWANRNGNA